MKLRTKGEMRNFIRFPDPSDPRNELIAAALGCYPSGHSAPTSRSQSTRHRRYRPHRASVGGAAARERRDRTGTKGRRRRILFESSKGLPSAAKAYKEELNALLS